MNKSDIEKGIQSLCETSAQVKGFYDQPNTLVEALNSVPSSELDKCLEYYGPRSGVIVDLRKEVIQILKKGKKLTTEILENLINKHRSGKVNQFAHIKAGALIRGIHIWVVISGLPLTQRFLTL